MFVIKLKWEFFQKTEEKKLLLIRNYKALFKQNLIINMIMILNSAEMSAIISSETKKCK